MWVEDTPNFLQTFFQVGFFWFAQREGLLSGHLEVLPVAPGASGELSLQLSPFLGALKRFWQLVLDATECLCACIEYKIGIKLIDITLNIKRMLLNSTNLYLNLSLFSYFSG